MFEKINNSKRFVVKLIKEKSKKVENSDIRNLKVEFNKYVRDEKYERILFVIYDNKFEIN